MKFRRKLKSKSEVPIVGYRVWRRESGYLVSITQAFRWPLRKPMVRDVFQDMGIHAVKTVTAALDLAPAYSVDVVGEVYLWGEVQEFTGGFLAEFAYPKRLFVPEDGDPTEVMKLEENYGVPVEMRSEIRNTKIPPAPQVAQFQIPNMAEIGRLLAQAQAGAMPPLKNAANNVNPFSQGISPFPQATGGFQNISRFTAGGIF